MEIDEITRNAFLAPLMEIQDIPAFDCDGEYQLEESDFWNIYTPDEMNIPEIERENLIRSRNTVKESGELFRQDVEKFLSVVSDQETLKAAEGMLFSLDSFSELYSGLMQYSERLEQVTALEQTISELEPIAKKQPGLLAAVERLKSERDNLKEKLHKPRHGEIQKYYDFCQFLWGRGYKNYKFSDTMSLSTFTNCWNGIFYNDTIGHQKQKGGWSRFEETELCYNSVFLHNGE